MPSLANITINNGAAVPVAKTFAPIQIDTNLVASYADRSDGISIGFPIITISNRKQSNGGYKAKVNIALPILEAASAATSEGYDAVPRVAFVCRSNHEFFLPARSTEAHRKDILAFSANILGDAVVAALVEQLESVY